MRHPWFTKGKFDLLTLYTLPRRPLILFGSRENGISQQSVLKCPPEVYYNDCKVCNANVCTKDIETERS